MQELGAVYNNTLEGPSWSWSYGSWIYNYMCNQFVRLMMFNNTFNNILVTSWRSVLCLFDGV
jgi:hypothetical protein